MVVAKVRARDVPVKVLGFQVEGEHVGEQDIQRARELPHGLRLEVVRRVERSSPQHLGVSNAHSTSPCWLADKICRRTVHCTMVAAPAVFLDEIAVCRMLLLL